LVVLAVGASLPVATAQGGGSVGNVAPEVVSLTSATAYLGHQVRLRGVVGDGNGEADLVALHLEPGPTPPDRDASTHALAAADLAARQEPSTASDGWRVWDPAPGDGEIEWSYTWVPETTQVHGWNLTVSDEAPGDSAWLNVTVRRASDHDRDGSRDEGPDATSPEESPGPEPTDEDDPETPPADGTEPVTDLQTELESHGHDLTWSLVITHADGQAHLEWALVPGALGYQVWRSMSPFQLRHETAGDETSYAEAWPDGPAAYKVTYFDGRTAEGGWAPDGDHADLIPGWNVAEVGKDGAVLVGVLACVTMLAAVAVLWAWRRSR
jgi:hypothetical protein